MLMTPQQPVQLVPVPLDENPRLLIVDDELLNQELFARIFEYGYVLDSARTGEEALRALDKAPYDAVLLDVMLPGMNGYEVLRRIRAVAETVDLPVIMISARTNENDVLEG